MDVVIGSTIFMAVLGAILMSGLMLMVRSDHSEQEEELVGHVVPRRARREVPVEVAGRR